MPSARAMRVAALVAAGVLAATVFLAPALGPILSPAHQQPPAAAASDGR
jgi:hypothetical protein